MMTAEPFIRFPGTKRKSKELVKNKALAKDGDVQPDRLRQVWFAGAHASVGGGYPDDGLSLVALGWMIGEAQDKGLRFMPSIVAEFAALANPTGRMYDPRSGLGAFYRYQPRDAQKLLGEGNTPLVYGSVMTRIASGTEGYAPISLPEKINVLPPHGPPVAFTEEAVKLALANSKPGGKALSPEQRKNQELVLRNTLKVATAVNEIRKRSDRFRLVLDTVWWRRITYFVSIGFVLIAAAFPFLPFPKNSLTDPLEMATRGPVGSLFDLTAGFLPWFLEPWITAVRQHPVVAAAVLIGLLLSLWVSAFLQRRICDRARATWNAGTKVEYLQPTGQRGALLTIALSFGFSLIVALATRFGPPEKAVRVEWIVLFAVGAAVFGALWAFRRGDPAQPVDPAKPGFLLNFARNMRAAGWTVAAYRFTAQKAAPAAFLFLAVVAVLSLLHRGAFDIASASGATAQLTRCTSPAKRFSVRAKPSRRKQCARRPDFGWSRAGSTALASTWMRVRTAHGSTKANGPM
jgi:hypothetical protein